MGLVVVLIVFLVVLFLFLWGGFKIVSKNDIIQFRNSVKLLETELDLQKKSNDELLKQLNYHSRLSRLVTQSPNGIMIMDRDCNVTDVNHGFEQMYEYNYEQFIKARGSNYRKTSFSAEVHDRIDRIFKTKQPIKYEALNITRSGKELWTQTALMPILDENGEIDGLVTIDTDIHKRIITGDALIERMEDINHSIDSISSHFKRLSAETKSLFETISQANELLDQTNSILKFVKEISDNLRILGINASIEAHLAGQNGRGFRVVANEIVDIASRSLQYVTQISAILTQVSENQAQLLIEKGESADALSEHHRQIQRLKTEIIAVERAITEIKTLS